MSLLLLKGKRVILVCSNVCEIFLFWWVDQKSLIKLTTHREYMLNLVYHTLNYHANMCYKHINISSMHHLASEQVQIHKYGKRENKACCLLVSFPITFNIFLQDWFLSARIYKLVSIVCLRHYEDILQKKSLWCYVLSIGSPLDLNLPANLPGNICAHVIVQMVRWFR